MHALLHAKLKVAALIAFALAVALTIAARHQPVDGKPLASADSLALFQDFDSDNHPDEIELNSNGTSKSISVHLSHSSTCNLVFDSEDSRAGTLVAADIDSDQDLDLIWITPNRPSLSRIWLGDGHGNFEIAPEPARYLKAVAALEASSQGSHVSGGDGPNVQPVISTVIVATQTSGVRLISFTSPSLPDRTLEPVKIRLHSSASSERGPPLYS